MGYSFNLDGSMMFCTFATLFIAQAYNIELTATQLPDAGTAGLRRRYRTHDLLRSAMGVSGRREQASRRGNSRTSTQGSGVTGHANRLIWFADIDRKRREGIALVCLLNVGLEGRH